MQLKYFLSLVVFLVISAGFVSTQPISTDLSIVSVFSIIAFAMPSFYVVLRWLGWRYGLFVLASLGGYALLIETVAIFSGVPYGSFSYGELLDHKLFNKTPWTVAFAWTPIMLFALSISRHTKSQISYWLMAIIVLLAVDLVLDPAAVALGFWSWDEPGMYYGVPLINFAGWVISGTIAFLLFQKLNKTRQRIPIAASSSGVGIIIFWTTVNIGLMQWVPAIIGMLVSGATIRFLLQHNMIYLYNKSKIYDKKNRN